MTDGKIHEQLLIAKSGQGTKVLSAQEARTLVLAGEVENLFLVSAEVYEIRDDLEVPRVDLSLYNICNEVEISSLQIPEKKMACRAALDDMIRLSQMEKKEFGFRVWLED